MRHVCCSARSMATTTRTKASSRKLKNGSSSTTHYLGGVIDGAEALVAATADVGEGKIVDLRESLQAELEAARDQLEKLETDLKDRATSIDDYVHENPWQAIGVAAAAGVLVGAIAFRR
jgi:ElaB/YqjD/DUF883 family membrane-anchored ribosome-binding protein